MELLKTPRTLGHHACPRSMKELSEAPELNDEAMPLRLVIPPVTPGRSDLLDDLLLRLAARENTTLVLNDWGTLAYCATQKKAGRLRAALCLGALLNAQDTDPVLQSWTQPQPDHLAAEARGIIRLRWTPPPETLTAHWRCPSALHWTPLLHALHVEEVELCRQAIEPPPEIPGFRVFRLPYAIVSVLPCGGDCSRCGGKALTRCGRPLRWDRNMLIDE